MPLADAIALVQGYGAARGYPSASAAMRAGDRRRSLSDLEVPLTLAWAEYDRLVRNRPLPDGVLPPTGCARSCFPAAATSRPGTTPSSSPVILEGTTGSADGA